jgi:hypothetical protein
MLLQGEMKYLSCGSSLVGSRLSHSQEQKHASSATLSVADRPVQANYLQSRYRRKQLVSSFGSSVSNRRLGLETKHLCCRKMSPHTTLAVEDGVAIVTLVNPPVNALHPNGTRIHTSLPLR